MKKYLLNLWAAVIGERTGYEQTPPSPQAPKHSVLDLVSALAPVQPPRAAAEQFADKHQQERDVAVAKLYRRVIATNNRNVTRNVGDGRGDVADDRPLACKYASEEVMTPSAYQELQELGYGVPVTEVDRKRDRAQVPKYPKDYEFNNPAVLAYDSRPLAVLQAISGERPKPTPWPPTTGSAP